MKVRVASKGHIKRLIFFFKKTWKQKKPWWNHQGYSDLKISLLG